MSLSEVGLLPQSAPTADHDALSTNSSEVETQDATAAQQSQEAAACASSARGYRGGGSMSSMAKTTVVSLMFPNQIPRWRDVVPIDVGGRVYRMKARKFLQSSVAAWCDPHSLHASKRACQEEVELLEKGTKWFKQWLAAERFDYRVNQEREAVRRAHLERARQRLESRKRTGEAAAEVGGEGTLAQKPRL